MENDPILELNIGDTTFEMTRLNSSLFTFLGEAAIYNHVFLVHEQEETRAVGTYVWSHHEAYNGLAGFIVEHSFPMHLNMLQVADCDVDAYDNAIASQMSDVGDSFPEDWS